MLLQEEPVPGNKPLASCLLVLVGVSLSFCLHHPTVSFPHWLLLILVYKYMLLKLMGRETFITN